MPQTCIQITLDFTESVHCLSTLQIVYWYAATTGAATMKPEGTHKTNLEHQLLHHIVLLFL